MKPAIRITNVSKLYRLGELQHHWTIGDKLAALFSRRGPEANGNRQTNGNGHRARNGAGHEDEIWALKDVSFDVAPGEVVGIIGRNGAGKSTLLKILSRITEPTTGQIELHGRVSSLLEVGTGFHPELTGRDNIYLNGSVLGMRKAEIDRKFDEIVDFSGVEKFLDTPVKRYSSGMQVRLAFAVAAYLEPEILMVDEVLAVGDAEFQQKCLGKMSDVATAGRTVIFVSHNLAAVDNLCSRAIVLDGGGAVYDGETTKAISRYLQLGRSGRGRVKLKIPHIAKESGIILHSVASMNSSREIAQYFKTGDDIEIAFDLSVKEWASQESLRIAVFLQDVHGLLISKCYSAHQSQMPLTVKSRGLVSCLLRNLRIVPGQYTIDVLVRLGHKDVCRLDRVLTFDVEYDDIFCTGTFPRRHSGVFFPDVIWRCEEVFSQN